MLRLSDASPIISSTGAEGEEEGLSDNAKKRAVKRLCAEFKVEKVLECAVLGVVAMRDEVRVCHAVRYCRRRRSLNKTTRKAVLDAFKALDSLGLMMIDDDDDTIHYLGPDLAEMCKRGLRRA